MSFCAIILGLTLSGAPTGPRPLISSEVLASAPPADWRALDPERTLYLELPSGRVVIELAPAFAPQHVANIRLLARGGYFDGLRVLRVQDNYVAQWGDPDGGVPERARPLGKASPQLPAEFVRSSDGRPFTKLRERDAYAPEVGWSEGFPVGRAPKNKTMWLAHCYGMVGAGRDHAPDSSQGAELYAVIGHAPRHLDRNITLVGRVVWGMEHLSALPRGQGPMGFYEKEEQRLPIVSARLASEVPAAERTPLELLRTDTQSFQDYVEARRNRREGWFVRPAGGIDLCNVPLPVRRAKPRP